MGKRTHDADAMAARRDAAAAAGVDVFDYSAAAMTSGSDMHPALDPAFGGYRYCNDPEPGKLAVPLTVMLDVTGSNAAAALKVHRDLPSLLGLLTVQGWVQGHLNIQIGAVGDMTCDDYPLQLSQFEPDGVTIDSWLEKLVLEGGGGGQSTESYELAMWALVNQNRLQCWERGVRGDLFIIFDEEPYPRVSAAQLRKLYARKSVPVLNDGTELSENQRKVSSTEIALPQADIPLATIAAELRAKYDVRCIICQGTTYWNNSRIQGVWAGLFGEQNIIKLPNAEDISEMIAALMGAKYSVPVPAIEKELLALGTGKSGMDAIHKALAIASTGTIATGAVGKPGSARVTRL